MDCRNWKKQIPLLLDELLEEEEARTLEAHLALCATCQTERGRLEKLFGLAEGLPVAEPPLITWQKIRENLPRAQPLPVSTRVESFLDRIRGAILRSIPAYAGGLATAFLVIAILPGEKTDLGLPQEEKPGVSESMNPTEQPLAQATPKQNEVPLYQEEYPVRLSGESQPGSPYFDFQDGVIRQLGNLPDRSAVSFPVREVGLPAGYGNKNPIKRGRKF